MSTRHFAALLAAICCLVAHSCAAQTIEWDTSTQHLIAPGGVYGRITRLANGDLMLVEDFGGQTYVQRSTNNGASWSARSLVGQNPNGIATNGEILQLQNGSVLVLWDDRPTDGVHNYRIRASISADGGHTWGAAKTLYTADTQAANGCWEPAAVQLPNGQIQVFFANENNFRSSNDQEITTLRSDDNGLTWSAPQRTSYRPGYRDGMPVPLLLKNGHVAVSIEDPGLSANFVMKPTILDTTAGTRWGANNPPLTASITAAAPYLRQFPTGPTVLSVQSDTGGAPVRQVVYVGDANAQNFASQSIPFTPDSGQQGLWNSLFIKNAYTVTAVSGTTIGGQSGLWSVDGYLAMPGSSYYYDTTDNTTATHLDAGNATWSPTSTIWAQHIGSATGQARWFWAQQAGAPNNAYFVADGTSTVTVSGAVSANSLTFYGTGYTIAGSALTLIGEARLTSTVTGPAAPMITAPLAGSRGLTKTGPGAVILAGANTYTGSTSINEGALQFNSISAIPGTGRNVSLSNGATAAAGYPIDNAILSRISTSAAGVIALGTDSSNPLDFTNLASASLGAVGSATYSGALTPAGSTYRLGGGGGQLAITSSLAGARSLEINTNGTAPGEVILAAPNTHTGVTHLAAGTLTFAHPSALQNSTLYLDPSGSGTINLNNLSPTFGGLQGGRSISLPTGQTLSVGNNNQSTTFTGSLTGPGNFQKIGGGTLTLDGSNSYTGATTISSGTLKLGLTAPPASPTMWFDAADTKTLFQDTAGTIPVTAAGQPIALWRDKSGNHLDAAQPNAAQKPIYSAAAQNNLGALSFTPGADFAHDQGLTTNYNGSLGSLTAFVVYKMDTWNQLAWARLLDKGWDSSFFVGARGSSNADFPQDRTGFGGGDASSVATAPGTDGSSFHVVSLSRSARGGAESLWLDGASGASGTDTSTALDNKFLAIGFDPTYATHTDSLLGSVAEVLVYNTQLSDPTRQAVEIYLKDKWFSPTPPNRLPDNSPITIAVGASLDVSNTSETIGPLSGGGSVSLGGSANLTVNGTTDSTFSGSFTGSGNLTKSGSATLTLTGQVAHTGTTTVTAGMVKIASANNSPTNLHAVAISGTGTLAFAPSPTPHLTDTAGLLTLSGSGKLDLSNHNLLTTTPAATIQAYLASGAITSSLVTADPLHYSIGFADGDNPTNPRPDVPAAHVLLVPTLTGDINLDGRVNDADLQQLLASGKYNTSTPADWTDGDLNHDGLANFDDIFTLLGSGNYAPTSPAALATLQALEQSAFTPEPSFAFPALVAAVIMARWPTRARPRVHHSPFGDARSRRF